MCIIIDLPTFQIVKRPRVPSLSIRAYKKDDGAFHCDKCEFVSVVDKVFANYDNTCNIIAIERSFTQF